VALSACFGLLLRRAAAGRFTLIRGHDHFLSYGKNALLAELWNVTAAFPVDPSCDSY
jgi:hypothetical protein